MNWLCFRFSPWPRGVLAVPGVAIRNSERHKGRGIYSAAFRHPQGREPKEYFLFTQQISLMNRAGGRVLLESGVLRTWKSALRELPAQAGGEGEGSMSIDHTLASAATCESWLRPAVDVCDAYHRILFPLNALVSNALTRLRARFVTKRKGSAKGVKRLQAPHCFKTVPKFFASTLHALC